MIIDQLETKDWEPFFFTTFAAAVTGEEGWDDCSSIQYVARGVSGIETQDLFTRVKLVKKNEQGCFKIALYNLFNFFLILTVQ